MSRKLPALPRFDPEKQHILKGSTLNSIMDGIQARTPIAGEGLLESHYKKGTILRLDLPTSSSSSSSSESSPSSSSPSSGSSSSPSEGSGNDSSSSLSSPSSSPGTSAPSGSDSSSDSDSVDSQSGPPSGSKTAIVNADGRWICWFCEERSRVVFSDQIELYVGERFRLPVEFAESIEMGSCQVIDQVAVDRPGTVHVDVKSDGDLIDLIPHSWGLRAWSKKPQKVNIRIEGIRRGFAQVEWTETTEDVAIANKKFWSGAHEIR